jgi:very-short-patch-repair endonuclease
MSYIYNPTTQKELRKKLRQDQPSTERLLWSKIRNRQLLGFKFRRQYGIGLYVVDYCCPEAKLVIEIDGDSHFLDKGAIEKDKIRQYFIESLGFKVVRFNNKDITENISGVLEFISSSLNNNLT